MHTVRYWLIISGWRKCSCLNDSHMTFCRCWWYRSGLDLNFSNKSNLLLLGWNRTRLPRSLPQSCGHVQSCSFLQLLWPHIFVDELLNMIWGCQHRTNNILRHIICSTFNFKKVSKTVDHKDGNTHRYQQCSRTWQPTVYTFSLWCPTSHSRHNSVHWSQCLLLI